MNMDIFLSLLKAFIAGGAICLIGQVLMDTTKLTPGRILVAFVVLGVALTAVGVYEPFAEWAGAGAFTSASGGVTAAILCGLIASFITRPKEK